MIDFTNCPVDESWILYGPEVGDFKVITTCAEFAYARLKIAEGALEGYYFKKNFDSQEKYPVNKYGVVYPYPDGMFDAWENMAGDIIRAALKTKEKEKLNKC